MHTDPWDLVAHAGLAAAVLVLAVPVPATAVQTRPVDRTPEPIASAPGGDEAVIELTIGSEGASGHASIADDSKLVPVENLVITDETGDAGACGNVTTVARDIYNAFSTELAALGCTVASLFVDGGLTMTSACMANAAKAGEITRAMIKKWNEQVAKNSWATLGPRRWHVEPASDAVSHDGTIQSWGTRIFVHQQPFVGDRARVSIRKVDGRNPTEVTVCKTDARGTSFRIWDFRIGTGAKDGKLYTKEFGKVKGWVLSVHLAGKNATRRLEYRVRGTRL